MSANRWLARAEEIRRARATPAPAETSPDADEDIERAAIIAEGASGSFVQFAPVQEPAISAQEHPPERTSVEIPGHVQIGQLGQKGSPAAPTEIPEHPWVSPEHMRRLDWPTGGWQELHATLVNRWSAPRRNVLGTIQDNSRYAPDIAARLAFSELCDHWRRRHLPDEKDGTRARVEAASLAGADEANLAVREAEDYIPPQAG